MDYIFLTGLAGSLVLVSGAAWPEKKVKRAIHSVKNWLLGLGAVIMCTYAIFGYLAGGPIFFIFLQAFVIIASILMMLETSDVLDTAVLTISGLAFIVWSLFLFEGRSTVFFILGLTGIGLGYAFEMGTIRRSLALTLGSALIALFSYIEASWIFFWLNVFFALFSGYYLIKGLLAKKK